MATSAQAPASDSAAVEVQGVDFRRPTKFTREHVRRLEHAHETVCRSLATRLSTELRTTVEVALSEVDQLPYSELVLESQTPALVTTIDVEPVATQFALLFDLRLALFVVERLLGGTGAAVREAAPSDPTDLELAVARRAIAGVVDNLSTTWLDLAGVRLRPGATTTTRLAPQIVSPGEVTLALPLEVSAGQLRGQIVLALPYSSMFPLLERLEYHARDGVPADPATAAALEASLRRVDVEVRVEVGALELTLGELLALAPGDIVPLRRKVEEGVVVCVGDVPTYVGRPGRDGGRKAVQVTGRWAAPR